MTVNIPLADEYRQFDERAIEIWGNHYEELQYFRTPKDKPARIDGIICNHWGELEAIVEVKTRKMSWQQLKNYNYEWMISNKKIEQNARIAKDLCVPYLGLLYLAQDDLLIITQLVDHFGNVSCDMRTAMQTTTASLQGGQETKLCAFIDVSKSRKYMGAM